MLIVHHLENSRSQRLLWLLEEMELPYEVKRYERDPKTMRAPPELQARSIRSASRRCSRRTARSTPRAGRSSNIWSR